MLSEYVIKRNRDNLERINQYHQLWLSSGGSEGLQCLNYDEFLKQYNMTDREIIEAVLARGVVIDDADEYLSKLEEQNKKG